MSKLLVTSKTDVIEIQDEDSNLFQRKLVLKSSDITASSSIDTINFRRNVHEIINDLFELINRHNLNISIKYSLDELVESKSKTNAQVVENLIKFIVQNVESLILKSSKNYDSISIIGFLLQVLRKNFHPDLIKPYYSTLVECLKRTRNDRIIYELLNIWNDQAVNIDEIKESLLPLIKKNLSNTDHRIRSTCLKILAYHYSEHPKFINNKLIKVLYNFADDQDPRLRITSLELMILLHINGYHVSVDYYEELKQLLNDDFDQVRLLTTQLICLLGYTYPEFLVAIDSNSAVTADDEKIRLVDDVFSKICFMINDISVDVKVCAGSLLGQLQTVSSRFLLQTLDKKLMSDLKVRKFQKLRQKQLVSSEWTSSTIDKGSSDSVVTDEDNLNLLATGACGAFIHGLEDEFLEVRADAVDSLCQLALKCPKFAAKSIDFLVDMFNDEIESVRLKAIQALGKITHYVLLGDDQIDIVLSVIEDGSFEVRESLRDLLCKCKLATKIGLKKTTQALFNNLKKYYSDKQSIWNCFKHLGKNHSKFVVSLVSYLISLHPFIDITEPDINDNFYICSLILIYNGISENSAILPLLPKYIMNHYFFLKLKVPEMIPNIKLIEDYPTTIANKKDSDHRLEEIKRFFIESKSNMKMSIKLNDMGNESTIKILEAIGNDLDYLSQIESNLAVTCEIMKGFIDCFLIIKKKVFNNSNTDNQKLIQIEEAISLIIKLLVLYNGYNKKESLILIQLYLYLRGLYLKEHNRKKKLMNASNQNSYLRINSFNKDLITECRAFFSLLKQFDWCFRNQLNSSLAAILKELPFYETNRLDEIELLNKYINENFQLDFLSLSDMSNQYQKTYLDLIEPVENLETPIKYMPSLLSNIRVKAILHNFTRFDNIFIQINYSDNDRQLIPIESSTIKLINPNRHLIDTNVNLANLSCSDSFYVKLCICVLVDEHNDVKQKIKQTSLLMLEEDEDMMDQNERTCPSIIEKATINNNFKNFNPIEISKHIKIYFEPLMAKKFF